MLDEKVMGKYIKKADDKKEWNAKTYRRTWELASFYEAWRANTALSLNLGFSLTSYIELEKFIIGSGAD